MMQAEEIEQLISQAMPEARVSIQDLRGDGNHYVVTVESESFAGLSLPDQHRKVFAALGGRVGGILKGMTLTTLVPPSGGEGA